MNKTERGEEGIIKYLKAGGKGCLNYVMRFGKTQVGLRVASRYNHSPKTRINDILIIVPSLIVKQTWEKELELFTYDFKDTLYIRTIHEIKDSFNCGLLIIDEVHKFTSDNRIKAITGELIKYDFILGLTGTYPYGNLLIEQYLPIVDEITQEEALANKWISNFVEYNIPLELSNSDKVDYIKYNTTMFDVLSEFKGLNNVLSYNDGTPFFKNDFDLILSCYSGKHITGIPYIRADHIRQAVAVKMGWTPELDLNDDYSKQIHEYWSPTAIKERVSAFYTSMRYRNNIHNINEVKLEAVLQLYVKFKDHTIITFSESTEFADMLTDGINNMFNITSAISYHSGVKSRPLVNFITNKYFMQKDGKIKNFGKDRQLKYITSMIKIGVYNCINSVKALDEGFNVENIDIVITTSGSTNPMQYSQRTARGKTIDSYNKDKLTLIFNLYFDDFMGLSDGNYRLFKSRDKAKMLLRQQYSPDIPTLKLNEYIENN